MPKTFGENLDALCSARNLSARKLAKDLRVPHKTVTEWIGAGARMPRDPTVLKQLATYFGVSTHFLLFGEEDPTHSLRGLLEKTEIHTGLYEISIRKVKEKKTNGEGPQ